MRHPWLVAKAAFLFALTGLPLRADSQVDQRTVLRFESLIHPPEEERKLRRLVNAEEE